MKSLSKTFFKGVRVHPNAIKAYSSTEIKTAGLYNSKMKIFLAGEGDFSFSHSLARRFGHGFNITATTIDKTIDDLHKRYKHGATNVRSLLKHGAKVSLGVDCVLMASDSRFKGRLYDRVVYNYPHSGFDLGLPEYHRTMIARHQQLCDGFFENAVDMVAPNGEIHVTHKDGGSYEAWELEKLANDHNLLLIERIPFKTENYPGYHQKRGDGGSADKEFVLGKSSTYKFSKIDVAK